MTTVTKSNRRQQANGKERYLSDFANRVGELPGGDLPWLRSRRQAAIDAFGTLGFPTTRDEHWKYTNVTPLARTVFRTPGVDGARTLTPGQRALLGGKTRAASTATLPTIGPFREASLTRLVFVDGRLTPEHSQRGNLPDGTQVTSLRRALESEPELLEPYLGRIAGFDDHAFTALNTAFMTDGVFLLLPESAEVAEPIHIIFISTAHDEPTIMHPRLLVVARPGARATIVEHFFGSTRNSYFNNVVTEIVAEQGASIDHYKLQQESAGAFHVARLGIHQDRDSVVSSTSIALGARLARHEIWTTLAGEGAESVLAGLYLLEGSQISDHYTFVDHAKPHCTSRQLFKGIMNGTSRGIFTGRIVVREHAQKTSADQSNKNLILSDRALAESRPQLEIHADDVRCTHGSAIGRLDEDMIFYLRARGIGEKDARNLLTYAFATEILDRISVKRFRTHLEEIFVRWLPAGRILGGPSDGDGTPACS